ncbi:MAG: SseB family protein [Actinobacteria bacterium]|uniref:Unannotated protein n=1 Tax=freshwater metagenome TaxID=449393 RepID=A0A6J7SE69_9ZZZZ|nr:SseB family protein [Actinomycetota bacterium]MTB28007.1 SseB family protein [Actinomycetota bacterium]
MTDQSFGKGRSIASPAFAGDDGVGDPVLRQAIAMGVQQVTAELARDLVLELLMESRLLVAVVAVLDEMDELGGDKDSHMTVVSMVNPNGERGLLAFTGLDSMAQWDPKARPVPVSGPDCARAALDSQANAVVIDVMGPIRHVVTDERLRFLAQGR